MLIPQLIAGEFVTRADNTIAVTNPATQEIIGQLPKATIDEVNQAVASAQSAAMRWRESSPQQRARLMLTYQHLLKQEQKNIAGILSQESGKVLEDAMGDVWRGIEIVEHAANIGSLMMGETLENIASNVNSYSYLQPLGVCAGITPFNFPAMIPLWMFPMAIACGNAFVLKPSEQDPMTPMRLAELFIEAGGDPELLQIVHGDAAPVNQLLEHPDIKAVSFVGSTQVGRHIYTHGCAHGKRVQALCGAKNHMVVMPDADKEAVLNALVGASVGAAGQRCMAISVAVFVGEAIQMLDELAQTMQKMTPGLWDEEDAAYGALINQSAKERVLRLIAEGKEAGARCLLDGSSWQHARYPQGNWVGPTLFADVTTDMSIYTEEIFGPVLCTMSVASLQDAIALINANPNGNGTAIFTESGVAAREFEHAIMVGNVGINIPTPVPLPYFNFSGWRGSFFGDLHTYGKQAVRFYSETKTVTARWAASKNTAINTSINLK